MLITFVIILLIKIFSFEYVNKYTLFGVNEHRATHWLTTYQDFGFLKRSLVGSIYSFIFSTKPNFLYIFLISFFILFIKIILILILVNKVIIYNKSNIIFISCCLFVTSPYFIYFYLADLGRFDQINNLILIICIFLLLKPYSIINTLLISTFVISAIFVHESFLLLQFPFLYFLVLIEYIKKNKTHIISKKIIHPILILSSSIIGAIILILFGYPDEINSEFMLETIGIVTSFELRKDVLDTFFVVPWNNFSILTNIKNNFSFKGELPLIVLTIDFIINNFPFLIINIYLMIQIQKKIFSNYVYLNYFVFLAILLPFIVSATITFNDYYRVFASTTLFVFLGNIYFLIKDKFQVLELKINISTSFLLLGLFYNFTNIGFTTITAYSSSSPSIFLFLFQKFMY
tara:strand:+ start:3632 stop:4840 length:1209 start_codon:yes stop_codon:yes gene_type:complete